MRVAVGPLGRERREALGLSGFFFSSLQFMTLASLREFLADISNGLF